MVKPTYVRLPRVGMHILVPAVNLNKVWLHLNQLPALQVTVKREGDLLDMNKNSTNTPCSSSGSLRNRIL